MLAVQANCAIKDIGPGTTVGTFLRTIGGTISIGIGGTILQNTVQSYLTPSKIIELSSSANCTPAQFGTVIQVAVNGYGSTNGIGQACIDTATHAVQAAYSEGFSKVFLSYAPVAAVGWLAVLFLRHVPLRGHKPKSTEGENSAEKANGQVKKDLEAQPPMEMEIA